jgi:hypothetical protein
VPDLDDRFIKLDEMRRRDFVRRDGRGAASKTGIERVLREDVFDVCDEQFLMLLLVVNAERDDRLELVQPRFVGMWISFATAIVDRLAVAIRSATVGREINPRRSRRCISPAAL